MTIAYNVRGYSSPTAEETPEISENVKGSKRKTLKILQWNCDSLSTKLPELRHRLEKLDIDVCLIQETKLNSNSTAPKITGYGHMRYGRKAKISGGGLITYVKESLMFDKSSEGCKIATEMCTILVKASRGK